MKTPSFALIVTLVLALAVPARAESVHVRSSSPVAPAPSAASVTPRIIRIPRGTAAGSSVEDRRYALREALSENAQNFRGGSVIVISAAVVAIIILGVIIIILLL